MKTKVVIIPISVILVLTLLAIGCVKPDPATIATEYTGQDLLKKNQSDNLVKAGKMLFNSESYADALDMFNRAIDMYPGNDRAWHNRGYALRKIKRYDEALDAYGMAIEINKSDFESWNGKGTLLKDLKRYDEALESYDNAIAINQNYSWPWHNKAKLLSELDKHEEALGIYDEWIELRRNDSEPWNYKALMLFKLNKSFEALEAVEHAIEINQRDFLNWHLKGTILLYGLKRYDEAFLAFDRAAQISPDEWGILYFKLEALNASNLTQETLKLSDEAIASYPDNGIFWIYKAELLKEMKQYDKALEAYDTAVSRGHPQISEQSQLNINLLDFYELIHWKKGLIFIDMKNYSQAVDSFDTALEINNDYTKAKKDKERALEYMRGQTK